MKLNVHLMGNARFQRQVSYIMADLAIYVWPRTVDALHLIHIYRRMSVEHDYHLIRCMRNAINLSKSLDGILPSYGNKVLTPNGVV